MTLSPRIYALIVAAGAGTRAGGEVPKQYQPIAGKAMLRYSCEAFAHHPAIQGIQVVIQPEHYEYYQAAIGVNPFPQRGEDGPVRHSPKGDDGREPPLTVSVQHKNPAAQMAPPPQPSPYGRESLALLPPVFGGTLRTDSVRAGLNALALYHPEYVLVHDAARPFLSAAVIDALIAALTPEQGVVPVLPVVDTIRRYVPPLTSPPQAGGIKNSIPLAPSNELTISPPKEKTESTRSVWEEVSREHLLRIQTPQAFPFEMLHRLAIENPSPLAGEDGRGGVPQGYTDEAALWLAAGQPLAYVAGEETLRKMTTAQDIYSAPQLMGMRRLAIGTGFDVHALMPAGDKHTIRLGGIDIEHDHKLHGHSDADVALHAIVDALLGALAEGDIGEHYSPNDERWRGADSRLFVADAKKRVDARGGLIQHVDVTIICEQPKISPHRLAMRYAIAELLGLPVSHVSVKATTTEKLGFTGRGEGIAAQAVATVSLPEGV